MSQIIKSSLLAVAAALSLAAPGAHAAYTGGGAPVFDFYQAKTWSNLNDTLSNSVSSTSLGVTLTLTAVSNNSGAKVARRWDGVGVNSGFLDTGDLNSTALSSDTLLLTFSEAVALNSISFSSFSNGIFGVGADKVSITTGGKTYALTSNDGKSPLTTFDALYNIAGLRGQSFLIQATGISSSFRLANISVSPLAPAIPEPGTAAMLGLGLAGVAVAARRRARQD